MNAFSLGWAPLIPWPVLGGMALIVLAVLGFGLWRRTGSVGWRFLTAAFLMLALANPSLMEERRTPQKDVAIIVRDISPSQRIGTRQAAADAALAHLKAGLGRFDDLDVRVVEAGAAPPLGSRDPGTELFGALGRVLSDVPAQRLAGIALITDGQVHDVPSPDRLGFTAPIHALLDGQRDEGDRRILIKEAPAFGIVGKDVRFVVRVEDLGGPPGERARYPATAAITIRRDGGPPQPFTVAIGKDVPVTVSLDHGGPTVFELAVNPGPHHLTDDNKHAALVVNGVRDRLKVLLVTGEPHPGERVWRNLLKADPSVDLVHFTILRPPEKNDATPIRELSLIAFPTRELFEVKLGEFDLIILDHYCRRGILQLNYLDNIARYVRQGGALLEAAGGCSGAPLGLFRTPVGTVLPAEPSGKVREEGVRPRITPEGNRHPVTAGLPGAPLDGKGDATWGRWFRQVEAQAKRGSVVMSGLDDQPLMVLDRVEKGRVAQLLSDQIWLWTKGFEGGGPQAELLRRLAYWLMKEPDLEENDLRATVDGQRLTITRRTLKPEPATITLTRPDGKSETVPLKEESDGRATGIVAIGESGLYRVTDGTRTALAAAGALNPVEMSDVRTVRERLDPVVTATQGSVQWVGTGAGLGTALGSPLPEIRRVGKTGPAGGPGWIGFRANGDYRVTGVVETPLLPPWLLLLLSLGSLMLAWRREGR